MEYVKKTYIHIYTYLTSFIYMYIGDIWSLLKGRDPIDRALLRLKMFDQPLAAEYNGHAEIHPNKTGEFP